MDRPLEVWGGHECTVNRIGGVWRDQTLMSGHHDRIEDLDLFAGLGLKALRYPVLWERTEIAPGLFDWSWADARLERLRELGIRPIVGLVHHGSGPAWTNLLDPGFVVGLARFAGEAARRYPWVRDWTPVNEPLTTARFSALYGHWYPHRRDERSFWLAVFHQLDAVRGAMRAIRAVNPEARLIQTEDFGRTWGTEPCAAQADHDSARALMTWDVLTGGLTAIHPLRAQLDRLGLGARAEDFVEDPCPPDVLGLNHYITSDRFLDHRLDRYPARVHGGNDRLAYADVEAVRVVDNLPDGWLGSLEGLWERYRLPIAVTECHLGCDVAEQMRWLTACWDAAVAARSKGIRVEAVTSWALLGSYDWDSLLTASLGRYESGVFDLSDGRPRATPLADLVRRLALDGAAGASEGAPGWWRTPDRLAYPGWSLPDRLKSTSRLSEEK